MPRDAELDPFFDDVVANLPTVSTHSLSPPTIVEHCVVADDSPQGIDKRDISTRDAECGTYAKLSHVIWLTMQVVVRKKLARDFSVRNLRRDAT